MSELFGALGINGKLLLAQAVNFGILAAVLTKFLYKPMFRTLRERREKAEFIEQAAREAQEARANAEKTAAQQDRDARAASAAMLQQARQEADILRKQAVAKTEQEIAAFKQRSTQELAQEKERVLREAQEELAGVALLAAERVLERSVRSEDTERFAKEAISSIQKI